MDKQPESKSEWSPISQAIAIGDAWTGLKNTIEVVEDTAEGEVMVRLRKAQELVQEAFNLTVVEGG